MGVIRIRIISLLADLDGNTAIWDAIAGKHQSIFRILYHWASISDPYIAGDLLCRAAKKDDATVMKELLKHGLHVDSKDRHGMTAIEVATAENLVDMVKLLLMNGADISDKLRDKMSSVNLNEVLQKREIGHRILVPDTLGEDAFRWREEKHDCSQGNFSRSSSLSMRVSLYRGHPVVRRNTHCTEPGRLIRLPTSLAELKSIAGTFMIFLSNYFISSNM